MRPSDIVFTPEAQRLMVSRVMSRARAESVAVVQRILDIAGPSASARVESSLMCVALGRILQSSGTYAIEFYLSDASYLLGHLKSELDARFGLAAQIREEREGEVGRG